MSFDFQQWLLWKAVIFWSIFGLGIVSSIAALTGYTQEKRVNTIALVVFVSLCLVVLLGFFPIEWGYSTDRANYGSRFFIIAGGNNEGFHTEKGFELLTKILAKFLSVRYYFVAIAIMYIGNYTIAVKRFVNGKAFWLYAAVILSMGFTNYYLNTMRAGLAISFLVLGISMYPSKVRLLICALIAVSIHTSTAIPAMMIGICYFFDKTTLYYRLWLLSIPVSFVLGNFFMELFADMSDDDRTSYLTSTLNTHYNTGFRIDFIIYSLAPMAVGAYYIFKQGIKDKLYHLIYNSYLLANIFWILVIRANYSDRFAYLSWFLIPFILVYPLLRHKMKLRAGMWLAAILLGETILRMLI